MLVEKGESAQYIMLCCIKMIKSKQLTSFPNEILPTLYSQLMTKHRINIEEIVRDIKKSKLDNLQIMERYRFDHKQLVLVIGKLAADKHISFRRMINVVNECLANGDLATAK